MSILLWIVFGALVGWVAGMVMNSDSSLGWDILIGIVGSVIGGFIMGLVGKGGVGGFTGYSFLVALLGSCVLIAIVRALRR
jgi:uncharacterized membrane protein YeaQ/YmgE (transglycosylase-associated protein family)